MSGADHLADALLKSFPHRPTADQAAFMVRFDAFMRSDKRIFILKGYAGTGKTRLMRALADVLPEREIPVVLLAPTGRAAKVIAHSSGKAASTIHRHIYIPMQAGDGVPSFALRPNKQKNALYIIDEASMVGDAQQELFGRSLLEDLMRFVFDNPHHCRLLFIGDTAQLPPVGTDLSQALDPQFFERAYGMAVEAWEMREVVRQAADSGILANATFLRDHLQQDAQLEFRPHKDFHALMDGYEVQEAVNEAFQSDRLGESLYIVRSNKRANAVNQAIRAQVLYRESELEPGDHLMVTRNNYHWLESKKGGFIANGDQLEVLRIKEQTQRHGLRFAHATLLLSLAEEDTELDAWIHLDALMLDAPSFPQARLRQLYLDVQEDYRHLPGTKRKQAALKDPLLQALQVKFAYAVTCHKSQGGQWSRVLVEKPWLPEGHWTREDRRWLYTALTRATERVDLLGFEPELFI
jgi:exodeoxyribonuclease-5